MPDRSTTLARRIHHAAGTGIAVARRPSEEATTGGPVIASVSIRHDPMDVVDGVIYHEPIDEIIVSQAPHPIERWFHVDLPHRLAHLKIPVTVVDETP